MNLIAKTDTQKPIFRERLLPSWLTFIWALILLPSAYLVFLPINEGVGLLIGATLTLAVWGLMFWGSPFTSVIGGELWVGKAHIPTNFLKSAREIPPEFRFAERGPALDARAFVRFQVGVKSLVRFDLNDSNDPTPYWLVATRKPEALISAVTS